jgi:hypothetical protein
LLTEERRLPHMPLIRLDIVPNIPAAPCDVLAFLRMGFAISRKIIHSGRARWPYQLRTLTAKESSMRHLKFVVNCVLAFSSVDASAQDSARTVQYHSQDIVPIRPK